MKCEVEIFEYPKKKPHVGQEVLIYQEGEWNQVLYGKYGFDKREHVFAQKVPDRIAKAVHPDYLLPWIYCSVTHWASMPVMEV